MMAVRHNGPFVMFLLPSLAGVMLFVLLPFLDVMKRSLQTAVTGEFMGVKNYDVIFTIRLLCWRCTIPYVLHWCVFPFWYWWGLWWLCP